MEKDDPVAFPKCIYGMAGRSLRFSAGTTPIRSVMTNVATLIPRLPLMETR